MRAGVAAGHPATVEAGIEILADDGSAADAAVAACLASCVAETVMTGFLGGGHAIYWDAASGRAENLDCFVAVPGLGAVPRDVALVELDVPFGDELVHYAVGPASCAVPGVPAGLDLLWRRHGRLPWPRLVEPALRLARDGVPMPRAHAACLAMLARVMTMNEGERIYAPEGRLLATGDVLRQPGLVDVLETVAVEGAASVYSGSLAERLLALVGERGGLVTRDDLAAYEASWRPPTRCRYLQWTVATRGDLSGVPGAFERLPRLRERTTTERVLLLVDALAPRGAAAGAHTTNLVASDADGNACVLTTSLGLGSGDFVPGLDLHLNSMLGEVDLLRAPLEPGQRMSSMMAPTLVLDGDGTPVVAVGAAGGTRLRTALVGVVSAVLDEGLDPLDAVERPRLHPAVGVLHAEPGVDENALAELASRGWRVRRWPSLHHYFGGVSLIGRSGAAGDPRRSGSARTLG